jgi:hypothetical protein
MMRMAQNIKFWPSRPNGRQSRLRQKEVKFQIYKYLSYFHNSLNLSISIYALLRLEVLGEERVAAITHGSDTLHRCLYQVRLPKKVCAFLLN